MKSTHRTSSPSEPLSLHARAEDTLHFIRTSMERATSFTGVSGKGYVLAGVLSLLTTLLTREMDATPWTLSWLMTAALAAAAILGLTMRKAQQQGSSLRSANGRKLLTAFLPALGVGAVLTLSAFLQGDLSGLPGLWLCLYGVGVMSAGAYSVPIIPVMGLLCIVSGAAIQLTGMEGRLLFGLSMGLLHGGFGALIWRHHGG